jgi:DNA adenine methylase
VKKEDIKIDGYYFVEIDGEEEIVRIIRSTENGFIAELMTGKKVPIKLNQFVDEVSDDIEPDTRSFEESTMRRSPICWMGGKGLLETKNFILENMPPHDKYVEPFGGGASILIAKKPVSVEVYNDLNSGLVNFFRTVADENLFEKFYKRVNNLPFSRELYNEFRYNWHLETNPLEQAIKWFFIAKQSFGGKFGHSWGFTVNTSTNNMAKCVSAWLSSIENLPEIHERMKTVLIENNDWKKTLTTYSGKGWFAYCDPPYVSEMRGNSKYKHELTNEDHQELVEALLNYDGAVLLSGYDSPIYEPLINAGWDRKELNVVCTMAGRTKSSGLQGVGKVSEQQKRVEILWRNPEAMKRIEDEKNKKKAPSLF